LDDLSSDERYLPDNPNSTDRERRAKQRNFEASSVALLGSRLPLAVSPAMLLRPGRRGEICDWNSIADLVEWAANLATYKRLPQQPKPIAINAARQSQRRRHFICERILIHHDSRLTSTSVSISTPLASAMHLAGVWISVIDATE